MAKQSLIWTAIPNGFSDDKQSLRVSLFLSPRLDPDSPDDRGTLGNFGDFQDWPQTLAGSTFTLDFNGTGITIAGNDFISENRVEDHSSRSEDSTLWKALFPIKTLVLAHKFNDPSKKRVVSYQVSRIDDLVRNLYKPLIQLDQDQLPTVTRILNQPQWNDFVNTVAAHDAKVPRSRNGLRESQEQFKKFYLNTESQPSLLNDLEYFELYHTPPSQPNVSGNDPNALAAQWRGYNRAKLPEPKAIQNEIDFHKIVAALGQYPSLLRRLGLVIDLVISRNVWAQPAAGNGRLSLKEIVSSGVKREDTVLTVTNTQYDNSHFQPVHRKPADGDFSIIDGLLDLGNGCFNLVQVDPDGTMLKLMNFARTLHTLGDPQKTDKRLDPTSKKERELGVPTIRNAGLMLIHNKRGKNAGK